MKAKVKTQRNKITNEIRYYVVYRKRWQFIWRPIKNVFGKTLTWEDKRLAQDWADDIIRDAAWRDTL